MTDQSPRDLDWPTRRWLLWGLIAIGILVVIVVALIWFSGEATDPISQEDPEAEIGAQIEWSIVLASQGGQTVTLKADEPDGAIGETWVDGAQLERGAGDRWTWDMDASLPDPVVQIDQAADCAALNARFDEWVSNVGQAFGEVFDWQSRAFSQHALDAMAAQSCEIDEQTLQDIADGG